MLKDDSMRGHKSPHGDGPHAILLLVERVWNRAGYCYIFLFFGLQNFSMAEENRPQCLGTSPERTDVIFFEIVTPQGFRRRTVQIRGVSEFIIQEVARFLSRFFTFMTVDSAFEENWAYVPERSGCVEISSLSVAKRCKCIGNHHQRRIDAGSTMPSQF